MISTICSNYERCLKWRDLQKMISWKNIFWVWVLNTFDCKSEEYPMFLVFGRLKSSHSCQISSLSIFSPSGQFVKWAKFAFFGFSSFKSFKPWGRPIMSKEVFEHVFTKRAAYKMSKVCFFEFFKFVKNKKSIFF